VLTVRVVEDLDEVEDGKPLGLGAKPQPIEQRALQSLTEPIDGQVLNFFEELRATVGN
jgi:hypothetical protein